MGVNCKLCGKVLFKQFNLKRHIRNVHNLETSALFYKKNKWNYKCLELNCNRSYRENKALIDHLQEAHNKKFDTKEFKLLSKNEFEGWKSAVELKYQCRYVVSARRNSTCREITYYNCNRSKTGKTGCKQERQRQLKSQGSCKLNFCCTSQIKLINEGESSNEVTVHWNKTHYGHSLELQHLRLQKSDRENVALHLINGVTTRKIVDQMRDKTGEQLKRIDLLTVKDVNNIKKSFKIETEKEKKHDDIDLWVWECNSMTSKEIPVLLYKQQAMVDQTWSMDDLTDGLDHKIKYTLQALQNCNLKNLDDTVTLQIDTHLNVLNTLLSLAPTKDEGDFQNNENNSSDNKNINSQLHLSLTQMRREAITNICKKLSKEETVHINDTLNNKPVLYISKSAKNDHMYL